MRQSSASFRDGGFVSLLIAQGASVVEVASQAGHTRTMALDTYAHLFAEFEDAEKASASDLIRRARARTVSPAVSVWCPRGDDPITIEAGNPCKSAEPTRGLEPRTLHYE